MWQWKNIPSPYHGVIILEQNAKSKIIVGKRKTLNPRSGPFNETSKKVMTSIIFNTLI